MSDEQQEKEDMLVNYMFAAYLGSVCFVIMCVGVAIVIESFKNACT